MKKVKLSMTITIITTFCLTFGIFATGTAEARDVTDTRYEVFFLGAPPGCTSTTMTFRADQVLTFDCLDGYGIYYPTGNGNSFTATFWANTLYLDEGALFSITGIALDPFILAVGLSIIGDDVGWILLSGYLLSVP